jgi:hypothetical protein
MRQVKNLAGQSLVLVMLVASLPTLLVPGSAAEKENFTKEGWIVGYRTGTIAAPSEIRLRLALVDQEAKSKVDGLVFSIPSGNLAAVYIDEKEWRRSTLVSQIPRSGCHYADLLFQDQMTSLANTPANSTIMALPAKRNVAGAFSESILFHHPIALFWYEGMTQEAAVVNVNECEYGPLVSLLQIVSGARWADLEHDWSTIKPGHAPVQSDGFSIQIDRRTVVGTAFLNTGPYRVSWVDGPGSKKILMFFDFKGRLIALARAHATPVTNKPAGILLHYASGSPTASLDRIETPAFSLTIEN